LLWVGVSPPVHENPIELPVQPVTVESGAQLVVGVDVTVQPAKMARISDAACEEYEDLMRLEYCQKERPQVVAWLVSDELHAPADRPCRSSS